MAEINSINGRNCSTPLYKMSNRKDIDFETMCLIISKLSDYLLLKHGVGKVIYSDGIRLHTRPVLTELGTRQNDKTNWLPSIGVSAFSDQLIPNKTASDILPDYYITPLVRKTGTSAHCQQLYSLCVGHVACVFSPHTTIDESVATSFKKCDSGVISAVHDSILSRILGAASVTTSIHIDSKISNSLYMQSDVSMQIVSLLSENGIRLLPFIEIPIFSRGFKVFDRKNSMLVPLLGSIDVLAWDCSLNQPVVCELKTSCNNTNIGNDSIGVPFLRLKTASQLFTYNVLLDNLVRDHVRMAKYALVIGVNLLYQTFGIWKVDFTQSRYHEHDMVSRCMEHTISSIVFTKNDAIKATSSATTSSANNTMNVPNDSHKIQQHAPSSSSIPTTTLPTSTIPPDNSACSKSVQCIDTDGDFDM